MTDDGCCRAATAVLANRALVAHLAAFQPGYPYAVFLLARMSNKSILFTESSEPFGPKTKTLVGALPKLAVSSNDAQMLRVLFDLRMQPRHQSDPLLSFEGVDHAAVRLQRVEMLECVAEYAVRDPAWTWDQALLTLAVERARGDLRTLDWVYEHLPQDLCVVEPQTTTNVAGRGEVDTVRWLYEHGFRVSEDAVYSAADLGRIEVLEYLYQHTNARCCMSSICLAAARGALDIVKLTAVNLNELDANSVLYFAANHGGHLDVVKFLVENGIGVSSPFAINGAAASGHLDVVKYLHDHIPGGCTKDAMALAAGRGHLEVVRFLHENRTEGCTTSAMDSAASQGHLEIVRFLHENRTEGCTASAMDSAAYCGRLEVVQFLHEHRTEGCRAGTMDGAAAQGHLEIVEFLHKNRSEGCTTAAMDGAASKGHIKVVEFLHKHRTEGCTTAAMDGAATFGHLDVVKFLHKYRKEGCTPSAMEGAVANNRLEVVKFLRKHRSPPGKAAAAVARWARQWRPWSE